MSVHVSPGLMSLNSMARVLFIARHMVGFCVLIDIVAFDIPQQIF